MIENFTIIESGGGFIPADFFAPTDKPSYQAAKVTVEPLNITSDGDGLQAYIKYGLIITQKITLTGPQEATDENIFDLVNEPPVPTELNGSIRKAISSPSTTNAIITKPSPTNQYDVFLHYHNDISHVFDERWNVGGGGPRAMEQFINLEIIPDGSASTTVIANDGSTANTRNQGSSSSTLSDATSLSNQLRPDTGLTYGS